MLGVLFFTTKFLNEQLSKSATFVKNVNWLRLCIFALVSIEVPEKCRYSITINFRRFIKREKVWLLIRYVVFRFPIMTLLLLLLVYRYKCHYISDFFFLIRVIYILYTYFYWPKPCSENLRTRQHVMCTIRTINMYRYF